LTRGPDTLAKWLLLATSCSNNVNPTLPVAGSFLSFEATRRGLSTTLHHWLQPFLPAPTTLVPTSFIGENGKKMGTGEPKFGHCGRWRVTTQMTADHEAD
jgi:hypothetical protein